MSFKLLIDGRLVDGPHQLDVVNPATGEVFATCSRAGEAEVDAAVAAAKAAFPAWAALAWDERAKTLNALADAIEARLEEFAMLLTNEPGKPLAQSRGSVWGKDVDKAVDVARRIDTGTVWVNKRLDLRFDVRFGGAKQSGIGREQGVDGLKEFTQVKVINVARSDG